MMTDAQLAEFVNTKLQASPKRIDAEGPEQFGCWGLVRYVLRQAFDIEAQSIVPPPTESGTLKLVKFVRDHPEHSNWRQIEAPVHGGVVEMGHGEFPHHIGLWLKFDHGGVLHAHPHAKTGVVFESLLTLKAALWHGFKFYERAL